jgi:PHD/YefM family antitoxin component YafN of YafNO toxin-antitoxin module
MITTIQVDNKLKEKLDKLKIHHRETYNELITRLIENCSPVKMDKESLTETIEVLSDPKTMRNIAEAMERFERGDLGTPIEEVRRELGL